MFILYSTRSFSENRQTCFLGARIYQVTDMIFFPFKIFYLTNTYGESVVRYQRYSNFFNKS